MSGSSHHRDVTAGVVDMPQSKLQFKRSILTSREPENTVYTLRSYGRRELINYKALLRRSPNLYSVKVGIFGSSGRTGQGIQAVGTSILPGDTSGLRSPTRSAVYSALTPGGLLPSGRFSVSHESRGYRCPEGFQYGGRFTDSRFSTCGQMLFDIFPLGATIGKLTKPILPPKLTNAVAGGSVSPIPGLSAQDQQIIIARAAQIPRIGPADASRQKAAINASQDALKDAQDGVTLMVRRDGFSLRPVVPTSILRTVPDNRNMEGGAFLISTKSQSTIGQDELGLLSNTGIQELNYVGSAGTVLSLRKTRPLAVGERRRLGRLVAKLAGEDQGQDPSSKLKQIAQDSNGAIEYSETFGTITNPNDLISVSVGGQKKQMRRWIYENFFRGKKKTPSIETVESTPADNVDQKQKITSLAQAVRHLETGGDPRKIKASILAQALQRARGYSRRDGEGLREHTRRGSFTIKERTPKSNFEHINARVTSDINRILGLNPEEVMFSGGGRRSTYLSIQQLSSDIDIKPADNLDNLPPEQMLGLAVSDFILDNRSRNSKTTQIVTIDGRKYIRSTDDTLTLMAGMPQSKIAARQRASFDKTMTDEQKLFYKEYFAKLNKQQRRQIVFQIDKILTKLRNFSWEEYISRLSAENGLSQAEKTHINILRSIIESRTDTLKNSKQSFIKFIS